MYHNKIHPDMKKNNHKFHKARLTFGQGKHKDEKTIEQSNNRTIVSIISVYLIFLSESLCNS